MTGLRARKKRQTEDAILAAGEILFSAKGFDATTVEDLAAEADVSVGTVYNYFPAKTEIMCAIMTRRTEDILAASQDLLAQVIDWPERAIETMLWNIVSGYLDMDRSLLREMLAVTFHEPRSVGSCMFDLDRLLMEQLSQLLSKLQEIRFLRANLPVDKATWLLYSSLFADMMMALQSDELPPRKLRENLADNIDLVLRSWLA